VPGRPLAAGDAVQTFLGTGVVLEVRNAGRLLVDVRGRHTVIDAGAARLLAVQSRARRASATAGDGRAAAAGHLDRSTPPARHTVRDLDLHGLTVDAALDRVEQALNDALLSDVGELRVVHGKGQGRIRAALHRRLRAIASVRAFRLDPRNEGVTILTL
jgi:hypothetical protein